MSKVARMIFVALCAVTIGAGGQTLAQSAVEVTPPANLKASGVLRVAGDASFPPVFYLDEKNEFRGFDIELATLIAQKMGLKVSFVNSKTEGLLAGLQAKRVDVGMSGLIDRPIREESFDFVNYIRGNSSLLIQAGNPTGITAATLCGRDIAAGKGTAADISVIPDLSKVCEAAGKAPVKSMPFPDYGSAVLAVQSGRVPASLTINVINAWIASRSDGKLIEGDSVPGNFLMGIAVQKGNKELVDALSAALSAVMKDGSYKRLLEKYDISGGALDKPIINLPKQ